MSESKLCGLCALSVIMLFQCVVLAAEVPQNISPVNPVDPLDAGKITFEFIGGDTAASHNIYVGTVEADVIAATGDTQTFTDVTTPFTPGDAIDLNLETGYYWRVEAVGVSTYTSSPSWFDVANFETFADFEDGNIWTASGGATTSSSTVVDQDVPSVSSTVAMALEYDNSAGNSEATLVFGDAKDFSTASGRSALCIRYHGQKTNIPADMYVTLTDSSALSDTVSFAGGAADIAPYIWVDYYNGHVDLADFSVDLSAIASITIGLSDSTTSGATGTIYLDNLRVYARRCIFFWPIVAGDIVDELNCSVDANDLGQITRDWLMEPKTVNAETLSTSGLIARFEYEAFGGTGTQIVDTVNGYTIKIKKGSPTIVSGGIGGSNAISLQSGDSMLLENPGTVLSSVNSQATFAIWLYGDATSLVANAGTGKLPQLQQFKMGISGQAGFMRLKAPAGAGSIQIGGSIYGRHYGGVQLDEADPSLWRGKWNHIALVIDSVNQFMAIYINGVMVDRNNTGQDVPPYPGSSVTGFSVPVAHRGLMDDFRIYNRALSQGEVITLAGLGFVDQPLVSEAEINGDGIVDIEDFAIVAESWMVDPLWP